MIESLVARVCAPYDSYSFMSPKIFLYLFLMNKNTTMKIVDVNRELRSIKIEAFKNDYNKICNTKYPNGHRDWIAATRRFLDLEEAQSHPIFHLVWKHDRYTFFNLTYYGKQVLKYFINRKDLAFTPPFVSPINSKKFSSDTKAVEDFISLLIPESLPEAANSTTPVVADFDSQSSASSSTPVVADFGSQSNASTTPVAADFDFESSDEYDLNVPDYTQKMDEMIMDPIDFTENLMDLTLISSLPVPITPTLPPTLTSSPSPSPTLSLTPFSTPTPSPSPSPPTTPTPSRTSSPTSFLQL